MRLTCKICRNNRENGTGQDEECQKNPIGLEDCLTPDDARDVIPHGDDEVIEDELQDWYWEDDQGLSKVLPSSLLTCKPTGSHEQDLIGNVLHHGADRSGIQRLEWNPRDELNVTPSVSCGPGADVVVMPNDGVQGVVEVEDGCGDDHGRTSKFTILEKEPYWHPTCDSSGEVE